jgi:hypothetical protein
VVLHRRGEGLDDEDVPFPEALLKADEEVVVGEALGGAPAQGYAQGLGDGPGQGLVGLAGEDQKGAVHAVPQDTTPWTGVPCPAGVG